MRECVYSASPGLLPCIPTTEGDGCRVGYGYAQGLGGVVECGEGRERIEGLWEDLNF